MLPWLATDGWLDVHVGRAALPGPISRSRGFFDQNERS
jgi:hypothetical protein